MALKVLVSAAADILGVCMHIICLLELLWMLNQYKVALVLLQVY